MIKSDTLAKIAGFGIFFRWHPAIALRYLPIVERINKIKGAQKILEVGSGGLGIVPYLKKRVTGIDTEFTLPYHPLLEKVKGKAVKLPFKDNSFDVVLSMDMLEHLPKKDRQKAINEMIRVAKSKVLIGVPCGEKAEHEDKVMHEYYLNKFGKEYKFFKEQIEEKLPDKDIMLEMIKKGGTQAKKQISVSDESNENISLHRFLMKGWMSKNLLTNIFFRKLLLFVIPLFKIFNSPPFYRQLFFIDINYDPFNYHSGSW